MGVGAERQSIMKMPPALVVPRGLCLGVAVSDMGKTAGNVQSSRFNVSDAAATGLDLS
jgi:hypothetical protein